MVVITVMLTSKAFATQDIKNRVYNISQGWRFETDGKIYPLDLDRKVVLEEGESLRLSRSVNDKILAARTLIINTTGTDVDLYLSGEKIYEYRTPESKIWYGGWKWHVVTLPSDASEGEVLRMSLRNSRTDQVDFFLDIYAATVSDFFDVVLNYSLLSMVICVLMMVLSIGIIGLWFIRRSWTRSSFELLNIGLFGFLAAISFSMRMVWTSWVFNDGVLVSVLSTYTALLMILPLLNLFGQMIQTNHIRLFRTLLTFEISYIFVRVLMEFQGHALLWVRYPIDFVMLGFVGTLIVWAMVDDYKRTHNREILRLLLPLFVLYIAMMFDMLLVKSGNDRYNVNLLSVMLLVVIAYIAVCLASNLANIYRESIDARKYQILFETDILTGLKNRNCYSRRIQSLVNLSNLCVIIMDVNNLKTINDTYGHQEGDRMIVDVSKMIVEAFGKTGYELFRIGGDEFAVFAFDKLRSQIEDDLWNFESKIRHLNVKRAYNVSVATGYAMYEEGRDASIDALVNRADQNMYFKKITNKL